MVAWIKINGAKENQIVMNRDFVYEIFIGDGSPSTDTNFGYAVGGHWVWHYSGYQLPLNQWVHIAVTYNGTHTRAFVNGSVVETFDWGAYQEIGDSSNPLWIGDSHIHFSR